VTQVATLSFGASEYHGALKAAVEEGYAQALGMWDDVADGLLEGCTISSSASRRSSAVTFTSQMPHPRSPNTVTQALLSQAVTTSATAAGITPPTVSTVQSATVVITNPQSAASDENDKILILIGILVAMPLIGFAGYVVGSRLIVWINAPPHR